MRELLSIFSPLLPCTGSTRTLGNFVKATYNAIVKSYGYLTPDLWGANAFTKGPYQEYTDYLKETKERDALAVKRAAMTADE